MASSTFLLSMILLFQLTDVRLYRLYRDISSSYVLEQNDMLHQACVNREQPHFSPIPIDNWIKENDLYRRVFNLTNLHRQYDLIVQDKVTLKLMTDIYDNAKVGLYGKDCTTDSERECVKKLPSEIYEAFQDANNEERKHYWTAWRDATGKEMNEFLRESYRNISTYKDNELYWTVEYGLTANDMLKDINEGRDRIFPLYEQLHAYIRRKLIDVYGNEVIRSDGPIPEHLIDLIGNDWWGLKDKILPYPEEKDLATITLEKGMSLPEIINICEDFYESLGFSPLKEEIWNNLHEAGADEPNCQNSIFPGCDGEGASMTICRKKGDGNYFLYYMIQNLISVYQDEWNSRNRKEWWPKLFNGFPTPGFELGMKGVIDISVSTREFIKDIGLLPDTDFSASEQQQNKYKVNHLFKMALWGFAKLQYLYTIAKWRLDVGNGVIGKDNMNEKWWKYSLKYRGVCPPVKRTESDFDPGALPEVAKNLPVMDDFLGGIYQYQFHKKMCKISGSLAPLERCNIYKSEAAGEQIREIIEIGKSRPWKEAMRDMLGSKSETADAGPLMDYYEPLYTWLKEQNKDEVIGWESKDHTVCP